MGITKQPEGASGKNGGLGARFRLTALVAASVMAFGGVAAVTSSASSAQRPSNQPAPAREPTPAGDQSDVRVCDPEYPYPGCSTSQIADLEAGTKRRAGRAYKAMRWGQKRDDFKKVGPRVNRILKRAFRHAKAEHRRVHPDQRLVIGSWRKFRRNIVVGGCPSFGRVSIGFWCHYDGFFRETVVDKVGRIVGGAALRCSGVALATSAGAGIGAKIFMVALTWRQAAAAGVAGCIGNLYSNYFPKLYE